MMRFLARSANTHSPVIFAGKPENCQ